MRITTTAPRSGTKRTFFRLPNENELRRRFWLIGGTWGSVLAAEGEGRLRDTRGGRGCKEEEGGEERDACLLVHANIRERWAIISSIKKGLTKFKNASAVVDYLGKLLPYYTRMHELLVVPRMK